MSNKNSSNEKTTKDGNEEKLNESKNDFNLKNLKEYETIKTNDDEHIESFVCKSSDTFKSLENKFYELHSDYKDKQYIFMIGRNVIDKEKTLEENKIGKNAKILIKENEL